MSANIYWRPVKNSKKDLGVGSPSVFIDGLREMFGPLTFKLDKKSLPLLQGFAAGVQWDKASVESLIEAIERNDTIEVFAEY